VEEGPGAGSREQSYIELVKIYSCLGGLSIGDRHARWSLWKICSCWGICWLLVSRGARHVSYMELVKDLIVMREARHVPWNLSKICLCWGRQGMFHGNCERPACVEGGKACYMEIVKDLLVLREARHVTSSLWKICLCWRSQGMLHWACERSATVEGSACVEGGKGGLSGRSAVSHVVPVVLVEGLGQDGPEAWEFNLLEVVDLGREVLLLKEHVHRLPQLGLPGVVDVLEDRSDLVSVPDALWGGVKEYVWYFEDVGGGQGGEKGALPLLLPALLKLL